MPLKELPEVDERRCSGCRDCIAVCPTECIEFWQYLPVVVEAGKCVSCGVCEAICPTGALEMVVQFC
jgi:NAD-dependent dihydropyrimidine dehydrogenase PreA subunit